MLEQKTTGHSGLDSLLRQPLMETLWSRRTHRVSRGASVPAGTISHVSTNKPKPLSALEEAVLIAVTGCTGLTMPDRPFEDPVSKKPIMAKPNLTMFGRSAGSPDNAQGTHFFLINDEGTYYLRRLPPPQADESFTPDLLLKRATETKVLIRPGRLDVPHGMRDFPAYLDSNRFLSNLPGTTILLPVVDLSEQYINGLMYILTQPAGVRPTFVDDRNFYRIAGVKRWADSGFLNKDIKIPLGALGTLRTHIEADLLLQNLMLVAEAMGLGAWIHACIGPPVMLGDPRYRSLFGPMLDFEFSTPKWSILDALRWQVPLPKYGNLRTHPVGLKVNGEYLIQAKCPPYYRTMSDAVDSVVRRKFGASGIYKDQDLFGKIFNDGFGCIYLREAPEYSTEVVECVRDVCKYIYSTHGRFPAHCDALFVPGVWIQIHHVEEEYYDRLFAGGLSARHRSHDADWDSL